MDALELLKTPEEYLRWHGEVGSEKAAEALRDATIKRMQEEGAAKGALDAAELMDNFMDWCAVKAEFYGID